MKISSSQSRFAVVLLVVAVLGGCEVDGDITPGDASRVRPDVTSPMPVDEDGGTGLPPGDGAPIPASDAGRVPSGDGGAIVIGSCEGANATRRECQCEARSEVACFPGNAAQVNVGVCRPGRARCMATAEIGTLGACVGAVLASREACDGLDNDCDGVVDNGCDCRPGATRPCYGGPMGTAGAGACRAGTQTCAAGTGGTGATWGPCMGETRPRAELCNGVDDDCNGRVDDGVGCTCMAGMTRTCYSGPMGTLGVGACRGGSQTCTPTGTGWGACAGERLPSPEVCNMVDDDCNGRVDDSPACTPVTATCPPPITGAAGTAVSVTSTPPAGAACRWEVTARPAGAGSEGAFADPMACSTTFSSVIVGTYTVRLTVTDAMGRTATCTTTITLTGRGLRVELAWDTTGDVDLHLLHPSATAWWMSPHDCYYANTAPSWDGGAMQSPRLDVDNTTSFGPENIRIDLPPTGTTYRVGVHAYSRVDGGSNATVRIYCGSATTPTRTFMRSVRSTPGSSASNDFWRVADVRMDSAGACTITPIDTVVPTSTSRTSR